jgi:3-phenylpropionate/trans-cinnamate dioxygenase ferredoxin subunit
MSPDLARERRVHAGTVDEFRLDEFRIVDVPGGSIGVVRTARGFFAVRNRCPHMGADVCLGSVTSTMLPAAPFEYRLGLESTVVRCPWHRWEFQVDTGESVGKVTTKRLVTYDVEIDGDDVYVLRGGGRRREPVTASVNEAAR